LIAREESQDGARYFSRKMNDFEKAGSTILAVLARKVTGILNWSGLSTFLGSAIFWTEIFAISPRGK